MIKTELDHCRMVGASLDGTRPVDDKTLVSLEVLKDRLERLKHINKRYGKVCFSPMAERLAQQAGKLTVG